MDEQLIQFLKSHKGTSKIIQTILAYHYDQIIREAFQELPEEYHDDFVTFMEDAFGISIDNLEDELK